MPGACAPDLRQTAFRETPLYTRTEPLCEFQSPLAGPNVVSRVLAAMARLWIC